VKKGKGNTSGVTVMGIRKRKMEGKRKIKKLNRKGKNKELIKKCRVKFSKVTFAKNGNKSFL